MSSAVYQISVREKNEIQCQRQLAVMNRLFKQWQKLNEQQRNQEERAQQFTDQYQKLRKATQGLSQLKTKALTTLNQEMGSFITMLNSDMRQIREQVIEERAAEARSQFHQQRNLEMLIKRLEQNFPHEVALIAQLQQGNSLDSQQLAKLIFRAVSMIEQAVIAPSEQQNELLQALKANMDGSQSFWQSGVPQTPFAMQCEQIALMIEKVRVVGESQQVADYSAALADIEAMPESTQRHVRADSLILVIAEQLRNSQKRIELMARLEQVNDELNSVIHAELSAGTSLLLTSLCQQAGDVSSSASIQQIEQLIDQMEKATEQAEQEIVSQAQRTMILKGLNQLGYEVRTTSVASWLEDGQVVVTHPATPGYGLELGGKQTRFQARTVAFSSQRDTQRDHDVDAIWCNQHQKLQDILAESGAELTLDRALPAGSGVMKVIETVDENEQRYQSAEHTQYREMKNK
ncbi:TPA: hypothetical protein ACS7ZY_000428 [Providencia alcalifaciens]